MIVDELRNWRRYAALAELAPAFAWLEEHAGEDLPEGRLEIEGDDLFALPQSYPAKPVEGARFEAHRRYADIQLVVAGQEMIGYAPTASLSVETPYDDGKDIEFYPQPAVWSPVALTAGMFAVFYPEDAHMPCCRVGGAEGVVRKVVVKVRV